MGIALIVMGGFTWGGGVRGGGTTVIDDEIEPASRHVIRRRSYID
jgi:hypothetical protein